VGCCAIGWEALTTACTYSRCEYSTRTSRAGVRLKVTARSAVASRTHSVASAEDVTCRLKPTSGRSRWNEAIASGSRSQANPSELARRIWMRWAPRSRRISPITCSTSTRLRRTNAASRTPASLRTMPRGRRSNNGTPISCSSLAIWRLIAEPATCSCSEASVMEPACDTARK
jgi:hypothetical protein